MIKESNFKGIDVLSVKELGFCFVAIGFVYILGFFIPLMENDSAQHAVMAMKMAQETDFLHLFRGTTPYLDKPHMHFWLSALSMKFFGINQVAYRLPSLCFTILGAFSCYRLALYWYGKGAGQIASLVFLSSQAIILANFDVRTDAVLTGATIFGLWQFVLYIDIRKLKSLLLAVIGISIAFMTKGQLAVFVIGVCLLVYIFIPVNIDISRQKILVSPKTYVAFPMFLLCITPCLYAYYVQFGFEGIRFILWDQSFNRLTGSGFENTSPDYTFFFHTILWTFFPWALLFYVHLFKKLSQLITGKLKESKEYVSSLGVLLILFVISFSKFKLPHYLNSLLPIMAVGVSGYLLDISSKKIKIIWKYIMTFLLVISILVVFVITLWSYDMPHFTWLVIYFIGSLIVFKLLNSKELNARRLLLMGVGSMCLINIVLNSHFYPNLLKYQAGISVARILKSENILANDVIRFDGKESWSLDFYTKRLTPVITTEELKFFKGKRKWLFVYERDLESLPTRVYSKISEKSFEIYHFRITRLKLSFINPNTRPQQLEKAYLIPLD